MNPTLREPEILEILPYDENRPPRIGDVVFFLPPESDRPVVHRIARASPTGLSTIGDNNSLEDAYLLRPESIKGRVVAAWHGRKRRKISGGFKGRLTNRRLRWRQVLVRCLKPPLNPLYQALSHRGLLARLLPASLRPRVIVFSAQNRDQSQLLLGRRIIGRFDDRRQQWQIRRPYRLFVDERVFPRQDGGDLLNRQLMAERRRTMNPPQAQRATHNLILADGTHWEISGGDEEAAAIVSQLGCAMRLGVSPGAREPALHGDLRRLFVKVDGRAPARACYVPTISENDGVVNCTLNPNERWGGPHVNLVRLSLIFARHAQARGGVLIHGALAERDGMGVIMAASGGTGKTTASNRLPAAWHSLCDDSTLVVRDAQGSYRAHPWPTWSRFLAGGPGGTWDVQRAVRLKGIFFLARSEEDRAIRVGPGHAVNLLVKCVGQASMLMPLGLGKEEVRILHLERFDNLCALARIMPVHVLNISLTGAFWEEMERALAETGRGETLETPGRNESG